MFSDTILACFHKGLHFRFCCYKTLTLLLRASCPLAVVMTACVAVHRRAYTCSYACRDAPKSYTYEDNFPSDKNLYFILYVE